MVAPLSAEDLADRLTRLTGWAGDTTGIHRSFEAPDFLTGVALVVDVARSAEEMNHHPDIDIRWRTVRFTVVTHSAGGVTELDVELARLIDEAADKHGAT